MIPISSVLNSVSALIATAIAVVTFGRMKGAVAVDHVRRDFFIAFSLIALSLWVFSMPGFVLSDLRYVGFVPRVGGFLVLIAASFLFVVPLQLSGAQENARMLTLTLFFIIAGALFFFDMRTLEPSSIEQHGRFIIYSPTQNQVIRSLYGIISVFVTIVVGVFFLRRARSLQEQNQELIRRRAIFFGLGLLVLTGGLLFNYIVFTLLFNSWMLVAASIAALLGLSLIGIGLWIHVA